MWSAFLHTHCYRGSVFADTPSKNNSEVVGAGKDGAKEGEDGRNHFHLDVEDGDLKGKANKIEWATQQSYYPVTFVYTFAVKIHSYG